MQPSLRTRREQPIRDEHLTIPTRPLARGGQVFGEKGVQTEVAVEFQSEPATAPLPWTMERKLVEPDLHHARVVRGRGPVMRKQGEGLRRGGVLGVGVERLAPGGALQIIDLAQIKPCRWATRPDVCFPPHSNKCAPGRLFCGFASAETFWPTSLHEGF